MYAWKVKNEDKRHKTVNYSHFFKDKSMKLFQKKKIIFFFFNVTIVYRQYSKVCKTQKHKETTRKKAIIDELVFFSN